MSKEANDTNDTKYMVPQKAYFDFADNV